MSQFLINKIVVEIIYSDLLLYDVKILQEIKIALKNYFPDSSYDEQSKTLVLINHEKSCNVAINKNRIIISDDSTNSFQEFKELSDRVFNEAIPKLAIDSFQRIGMRTFRGIEKKNNGDAYKSVLKDFIKVTEEDLKDLGSIQACGVNFVLKGEKYNINLGISPNFYQMLKIVDGNVMNQVNNWQLMLDSDVYLNPPISVDKVLNSFVEDVIKINENKIENFITKVSSYQ